LSDSALARLVSFFQTHQVHRARVLYESAVAGPTKGGQCIDALIEAKQRGFHIRGLDPELALTLATPKARKALSEARQLLEQVCFSLNKDLWAFFFFVFFYFFFCWADQDPPNLAVSTRLL
jgi:hypothetical protein